MEKTNCGNCNWHDEIQQKKTYCLIDDQWKPVFMTCDNFVKYTSMNQEERGKRARAFRDRLDVKWKEKREREFAEELAHKDREHKDELAKKEKEHKDELARKESDHADKLQQDKMKFEKRLWWQTAWFQIGLALISAGLGFVAGWLLT